MSEENKKWLLSINAEIKEEEINPKMTVGCEFDKNQDFTLKLDKESVSVNYNLKF